MKKKLSFVGKSIKRRKGYKSKAKKVSWIGKLPEKRKVRKIVKGKKPYEDLI